MAISFKTTQNSAEENPQPTLSLQREDTELKPYDIADDRARVAEAFRTSPEIEALTAQIDVYDLNTIVTFGEQSAEEISRASDQVLRGMNLSQLDASSDLLQTLSRIMGRLDLDELKEQPGFLAWLKGSARKQLDKILEKYTGMGQEVDRVYVQLRQYEGEIRESNRKLDSLFEANVSYYHELVKYITAGEQGCRELEAYIQKRNEDLRTTGDQSITFELHTLQQALTMLQQRTQDLRTAELVAMQSIPMIRTMQYSNMNLVRKINSAFIVTLPVFKQALAQAVLLKRQKIQAESMSALDRRTNELLVQNAKNTADQAKLTARLSSGGTVKAETLETTWKAILSGIDETRAVQEKAARERKADQARLEQLKRDFDAKYAMPARKT